jgi:STE24 endopeptidase
VALTTPWSPWPGHPPLDPVPERDFTSAQIARADQFHADVRPPAYAGLATSLLLALALGLTPLGATLTRRAGRHLRHWVLQVVAGTVVVATIGLAATLPFAAWTQSVLLRYGLTTQPWAAWLLDEAKSWGVTLLLAVLALVVLVGLVRRFERWWFVPAALSAAGCVVVGSYLYPVVLEPVFNSFVAMPAGPVRTSLLDLAERDDVHVSDVLVADASRRTTTLNAYVSGLGSTRRLVVYDTLLDGAPPAQVRMVVAHELGHVKENDVGHGTAIGALGAGLAVALLSVVLTSPAALRRSGLRCAGDPAVVALVLALYSAGSLLALPVQNLVSRQIEARADVHALDLTRDPQTFIRIQRRLAIENLTDLTPAPLSSWWFASHPSPAERIAIARRWAQADDAAELPPGP